MKEQQGGWFDIYAVDMRDNSIVVWADHAIVQRWEVFDAFTNWLRQAKSGRKAQQPARGD